jgi:ribosomal-protein-alanine N-acetyltransferase
MTKKIAKANFPTVPALVGTKVYLRPMTADDQRVTYQWFMASDPQTQTCRQVQLLAPEEYADRFRQRQPEPNAGGFLICTIEADEPVGKLSYFNLNMINRSAELGYIIAPEARRQGYAYEGMRLLISYLFKQFNLNKVYAQTGAFNEASVALLESLDFRLDGRLRQHHCLNGEFYDDYVYSLLKFESGF